MDSLYRVSSNIIVNDFNKEKENKMSEQNRNDELVANITDNISDRILGIIDAGKRSILDIDKEEDKSGDDEKDQKDDSKPSIGGKKIISTELS